jgi:hypothetical protein
VDFADGDTLRRRLLIGCAAQNGTIAQTYPHFARFTLTAMISTWEVAGAAVNNTCASGWGYKVVAPIRGRLSNFSDANKRPSSVRHRSLKFRQQTGTSAKPQGSFLRNSDHEIMVRRACRRRIYVRGKAC